MTGAAIVKDTSANIAEMLDEAIASTVKDINVDDNSTDNKLVLTVSQFRNLLVIQVTRLLSKTLRPT